MEINSKIALEKVKEAEKKAQDLTQDAKEEANKLLAKAVLDKLEIIKRSQEQAKIDASKLYDKIKERAFKEANLIKSQTEKDIAALKQKAQANIDKAVEFLSEAMTQH